MTSDARTSAQRKAQPIATGVLAYFPRALAAISEVSRRGNDKHNPGEPLHWAREKSTDEADSAVRHICDALEFGPMALDAEGAPNLPSAAWRVLAWLERVLEGDERWRGVARPTTAPTSIKETFAGKVYRDETDTPAPAPEALQRVEGLLSTPKP